MMKFPNAMTAVRHLASSSESITAAAAEEFFAILAHRTPSSLPSSTRQKANVSAIPVMPAL
jgi:hypothetical protein